MKIEIVTPHEDQPCVAILSKDQDELRELEKIVGEFDRHINKTGLTLWIDTHARALVISGRVIKEPKGGESSGLDKPKT